MARQVARIIAVTCAIIAATPAEQRTFSIQKMKTQGAFYEPINKMSFYMEEINLVTKFDLPDTKRIINTLIECDGRLKEICEEILATDPTDLCKPFRKELGWHLQQIKKQTGKVNEMYGKQKRGLIDIGGKVSKFVFGTMDADDSNKIYENLKNLEDNQVKFLNVQKENIAVIKSNFETQSIPITQLQDETNEIKEKLNALVKKTNDYRENTERNLKLSLQTAELMSLILIQSMHISKIQEEAIEIVLTLNNHKLHPLIVSYHKIIEIIKESNKQGNQEMWSTEIVRQLAEVRYAEIEGKIIIKVTVPMVETEQYTLYKVYLIPFLTKNGYVAYES